MIFRKKDKLVQKLTRSELFLASFEGIEGGFAIGAGIVAGLSFTNLSQEVLIATALISILVNGFNSASVRYSSAHYIDELDGEETRYPFRDYFLPSLVQFLSHATMGILALLPMFLMRNMEGAIIYTCLVTLLILLGAGYWRAKLLGMPKWRDGFELFLLGAGIIAVGYTSGWLIHVVLG